MIILNDSNLCSMIETMLEPFIKLIEKSKSVIITEAYFKLVKIKEYICVQDKQIMESTQNSFKYANTVNAQLSNAFNVTNSNFIPQQNKKMNEFFVFAYANKVTGISKKDEEFISQQNDIKSRMNKIKEKKIPKECCSV
jgi:hypothetical protein